MKTKAFDPLEVRDQGQLERFERRARLGYGIGVVACIVLGALLAIVDDNTTLRFKSIPSFLLGSGGGTMVASGGASLKMAKLYRRTLGLSESERKS